MPYDLVRLSINDSLNSLFVNISLGAGEILTFWHHMKLTIPAELWGHISHISVYLWGILLDGGMTEKEIKSLCALPLYLRLDIPNNLSRAISCLRLSGHNFLVQRMPHDRNRRPYELRVCDMWTRCELGLAHYSGWGTHFVGLSAWTSSQTSHTATAYLPTSVWGWPSSFEDLYEPIWYFWCCLFCS